MRAKFLNTVLLLIFSISLQAAGLPNVVIIYADDMGYGDFGANNPDSRIPTPNLDRLAEQGIRFTDGHSSSGICTPSRFALLTGQHHWRRFHGIVSAFGASVFREGEFTLPRMFKSKGYRTACIGKWHLGWDWGALLREGAPMPDRYQVAQPDDLDWTRPVPDGPLAQGFDTYFGDGTINFPPYCWIENDRIVEAPTVMMDTGTFKEIPEGRWEFRKGPMVDGWDPYTVLPTLTDRAVDWIEQQTEENPFFLYFALPSPHAPIIPNAAYRGKSQAGPFGDYVFESDAMAGRILQALEDNGFSETTLVVFTADNGPEHYAYPRLQTYGHWSSGHLRGLKRDLWEGGHRVPFVVSWPGRIPAGSVVEETISQVDLAATFAAIIGYELNPEEAIDSYDLWPVLTGKRGRGFLGLPFFKKDHGPLRKATVQNTFKDAFVLRQGDWVFIDAPSGEHTQCPDWFLAEQGYAAETTPGLLYNLKIDPAQHDNLYEQYPEKVAAMKALLQTYLSGQGCAPHAQ